MSQPIAHYSPARKVENFVYSSGQLGMDDGELVDGVAAQTDQALANLASVLAPHGATLADIVKTTIFLADIADYTLVDQHYAAAFAGATPPARSAVAVAALPRGARVEIEAIAYITAT